MVLLDSRNEAFSNALGERSTHLATFQDWTKGRAVSTLSTNFGAQELPFQTWRHFKEAFAPELVARAVACSKVPVKRCLDPFGGSGTTALACQFLGVDPVIIEVNPFLADLIEAKLATYDTDELASDFGAVVRGSFGQAVDLDREAERLPETFIEPGLRGRWIFDRPVGARIAALLGAINGLENETHRQLFRVLLGGVLVDVSNVLINGKGRRYRQRWEQRPRDPRAVDERFRSVVQRAIGDIHRFARRLCMSYEVRRGDCRTALRDLPQCDLAVFSPPYPNSFDYTDVYNLELWILGYLKDMASNRALRRTTLCSHVQIGRNFPPAPVGSILLDQALDQLTERRNDLWDDRIVSMVGGYFCDIVRVLSLLRGGIVSGGSLWMVVGDSRYADVQLQTASIISELAPSVGWHVDVLESCRSMRSSAQQGGRPELAETLIVLSHD
jgi:hypothetical protein